jgi:hypothetical protein
VLVVSACRSALPRIVSLIMLDLSHRRCLGLAIPPTPELAELLAITYPKAMLDTFARSYSLEEQRRFRFVCLSGALVERDQNKTMWFLENERKLRVSRGFVARPMRT